MLIVVILILNPLFGLIDYLFLSLILNLSFVSMSSDSNINRLLGIVDACIYIYHALPELSITDIEVKKALGSVARRCNELYESKLYDVFNPSDNG